jgi:hypothetical protein
MHNKTPKIYFGYYDLPIALGRSHHDRNGKCFSANIDIDNQDIK